MIRWILLIFGALVVGFVAVLIVLSIQEYYMSPVFQLSLIFVSWCAVWIGVGWFLKKNNKVKQPFAYGFMIGLVLALAVLSLMRTMLPSEEEVLAKAQSAEQNYFLLSAGSLDHARICGAAKQAYIYYQKAKVEDKERLFKHILITDKCL